MDAPVFPDSTAGRFSHIMKQNRPAEFRRRICDMGEHQHGVFKDIAFGVEFGRLFHAAHGVDFREEDFQNTEFRRQTECPVRHRTAQNPRELVPHPFRGKKVQFMGEFP